MTKTVRFRLNDSLSFAEAKVVKKKGEEFLDRGKGKDLVPKKGAEIISVTEYEKRQKEQEDTIQEARQKQAEEFEFLRESKVQRLIEENIEDTESEEE